MPYLEIVIFGGLKQLYRILDRKTPGAVNPALPSKKTTQ